MIARAGWLRKWHPLVAASVILAAAVAIGNAESMPLGGWRLESKRQKLAAFERDVMKTDEANRKLADELSGFRMMVDGSICGEYAGDVNELLRDKLEAASGDSGVKIRALGDVRRLDVAGSVSCREITVSADGKLEQVMVFLEKIRDVFPRGYWKTITIRPNNQLNVDFLILEGTVGIWQFPENMKPDGGSE